MIKIAVLMLIHKLTEQQQKLIKHLAQDFDVYVHIDGRTEICQSDVSGERVFAYKIYDVHWGSFNQIRATVHLFAEANKKNYERYLLISGDDVPLLSNAGIKKRFSGDGNEYLTFESLPRRVWGAYGGFERLDYFYPVALNRGSASFGTRVINRFVTVANEKILIPILRKTGIRRKRKIDYFGGALWMDLTGGCVNKMVKFIEMNQWYLNRFRFTRCADEIFFQTIICGYLEGMSLVNATQRYIDWSDKGVSPKILTVNDLQKIQKSDALFARKFDCNIDSIVVDTLYEGVTESVA